MVDKASTRKLSATHEIVFGCKGMVHIDTSQVNAEMGKRIEARAAQEKLQHGATIQGRVLSCS